MEPVSPGANNPGKLNPRVTGAHYEALARQWLEQHGLRFIAANVRCREGEVDLVMRDTHCWVFVEVRYRRNARFGGAIASITRSKQRRIIKAAVYWLTKQRRNIYTETCRFDVVAITGEQINWISDAFNTEIYTK
ncbi:YraN family protein [Enterobacteriaceae bacterium LUAb1]